MRKEYQAIKGVDMGKVLQMLQLQQQLNDETNGLGWEEGITKNGKVIDWRRCTYLECAELIESYPWKHWKNIDAKPDYENIKIEVVDIWHFILSQALQNYKIKKLGSLEVLSRKIGSLANFERFSQETTATTKSSYQQIEMIEQLLTKLFQSSPIEEIIEVFIEIALESELNLDALYALYIGKNILNKFRQEHGYKEGTYLKIWGDKEDNAVMQEILESTSEITPQALYAALEKHYPIS